METQTVSIKQHLLNATPTINSSKKSAISGIMKLGIHYKFTSLNHHEIIEVLEKARIKKGFKHMTKLSKAAGYGKSCYGQIKRGARFKRKSFDAFCRVLKVLNYDTTTQAKIEFNPINVEDMIAHLKSLGYKIQKPVTTYEEI